MLPVPAEDGQGQTGGAPRGSRAASLAEAARAGGPATGHGPAVAKLEERAGILVYRDDLYEYNGAIGGKVRSCLALSERLLEGGARGLVTASARQSPQASIVAAVGQGLGVPVRCHVPDGAMTPELQAALDAGAELVPHRPGYNTVIIARARQDAMRSHFGEVVFGMEFPEAIQQNAAEFTAMWYNELMPLVGRRPDLRDRKARMVVAVGSAMSLLGLLEGRRRLGIALQLQVTAVWVGADPRPRLSRWLPGWEDDGLLRLVKSEHPYAKEVELELDGLRLDPIYEAKAAEHASSGDLFWVIGAPQPRAIRAAKRMS